MLGAPVLFGASVNALLLDVSDATRLYRTEDADLMAVLERYLEELAVPFNPAQTWSDRVLAMIATGLGHKGMKLEWLAADLRIAPRSLQRRLLEEGTTLRKLVNEHRAELADRHLRTGNVPISRIAETLGYSDGTAFWRAHRRRRGESPTSRRKSVNPAFSDESTPPD